ncbi:Slx4p interacting protein [Friedmanniomyces endolithicus]|nr:Slx4p interacting protein [Friedmanniomyces endolithicus]
MAVTLTKRQMGMAEFPHNPSYRRRSAAYPSQFNNRFSPKSGKLRKRSARPRLCLTDRLANLHLLLRSNSFERWPLKVTFYAEDVYHIWTRCIRQQLETLRPGITVTLDTPPKDEASKALSGIRALDVGYSALKPQIEKTKNLFETSDWLHCVVCHGGLPSGGAGALVCNTEGCNAASHIECLSTAFLLAEGEADAMIPTSGSCPGCNIELQWTDLVRELSMRMRGAKEVEDLFRERRKRKKGAEVTESDVEAESSMDEAEEGGRLPEEDGWHELPESSWDEVWVYSKYLSFIQTLKKTDVILLQAKRANIRRKPSPPTKKSKSKRVAPPPPVTELIIEESDWERAEVIA